MIDIDKCKAAWVSQPLCQRTYVEKQDGKPTQLCAISALLTYAGLSVDLLSEIYTKHDKWDDKAIARLENTILKEEYGIPARLAQHIPDIFDEKKDEAAGIAELVRRFERHNKREVEKKRLDDERREANRLAFDSFANSIIAIPDIGASWFSFTVTTTSK